MQQQQHAVTYATPAAGSPQAQAYPATAQAYAVPQQQGQYPPQQQHTTTTTFQVQQPATQTTVIVNPGLAAGDGGMCCAIATFIIGFFFFPVWWGGCCGLGPHIAPCARTLNIVSTILGILFALWVPGVIIWWFVVGVTAVAEAASNTCFNALACSFYDYYYYN